MKPLKKFETKFSSKGMGKRFIRDPLRIFIQVLRQRKPQSELNQGFRLRNNTVYTYKQQRKGFSYFYIKRRVLDDGIHTVPLDIVLCPYSTSDEASQQGDNKVLVEFDAIDRQPIHMLANCFE